LVEIDQKLTGSKKLKQIGGDKHKGRKKEKTKWGSQLCFTERVNAGEVGTGMAW